MGGAAGAGGGVSPLCGWTPSSTRARVTFKKAFRSAGGPPTHLWSLSFAVVPGARGNPGARVGNGKAGKDKAALGTRWAAPLRNHATGFPKPLAQPLRFRISGLGPVQSRSFATPGTGLTTRDAQKKTPFSESTGRGWSPGKHPHLTVLAPTLGTLRPSSQHPQPRGVSRPRRFSVAPSHPPQH